MGGRFEREGEEMRRNAVSSTFELVAETGPV